MIKNEWRDKYILGNDKKKNIILIFYKVEIKRNLNKIKNVFLY